MVQRHISQATTATAAHLMVPLPPSPSKTPSITPIIITNPSQYRAAFGRRGYFSPHQPTYNSVVHILAVSIDGHS